MELLFLNVSNPEDSQNRKNKRIVKKWASRNDQRQNVVSPSPQPTSEQPGSTAFDEPAKKSTCWMGTLSYSNGDAVTDRQKVSSARDLLPPKRRKAKGTRKGADCSARHTLEHSLSRIGSGDLADPSAQRSPIDNIGLPQPTNLLGAASRDPFDTLPLDSDKGWDYMLHLYANGHMLNNSYTHDTNACDATRVLTTLRKSVWIPLALQSRAAYSALRKS